MSSEEFKYGELIRETRVKLGLTQRHIADQCGISDSALAHIERGMRVPSETVARQIADTLSFDSKVRGQFESELTAIREHQARERVRSRNASQKSSNTGGFIAGATPDAASIAQELADDAELREACHYLKAALSKRSQRKTILSALKAWASES